MSQNMTFLMLALHITTLLVAPIFVIGLINRTKALWGGRKGPNLNQFFFDLLRLLRKTPVYSHTTTWIFQVSPWLFLVTSFSAGLISPLVPGWSPISFSYDFVYFAYVLGLGRVFLVLSALDTGSSFEGMGASREATYSTLVEPALFFVVGTLGILSGHRSFEAISQPLSQWSDGLLLAWAVRIFLAVALFILLQFETARIPVDDPSTHLELTMIHEVMILDHSGPELAAVQYGNGVKLVIIAGLVANVLNPFSIKEDPLPAWATLLGIIILLSIMIGLIESLIARVRLRAVPIYALAGGLAGLASLVIGVFNSKVAP